MCIDPSGKGDVTQTHEVWSYRGIRRSMSTLAIADGLVFAADYSGYIHCLDAKTGELYWKHDTLGHIWGSPIVATSRRWWG